MRVGVEADVCNDVVDKRETGRVGFQLAQGGGQVALGGRLLPSPLVVERHPRGLRVAGQVQDLRHPLAVQHGHFATVDVPAPPLA